MPQADRLSLRGTPLDVGIEDQDMHIRLSPIRSDTALTLARAGDVLTINGTAYDFTALPEGATLPRDAVACDVLASDVERKGGAVHLTLTLPFGPDAPHETRFPAPIIDPPDGPVTLWAHEASAQPQGDLQ